MAVPSLKVDIEIERNELRAGVELSAAPGEIVALVGGNGSGKSTLLAAIAGQWPIARGSITMAGDLVERRGLKGQANLRWSAERRGVAFLPQEGSLDPRLTALENVGEGLRQRGSSRAEARERAQTWLDRLGVRDLGDRRGRALSGGETQIIALARTLALEAEYLLLDEPFAALDNRRGARVRVLIENYLASYTGVVLMVCHNPVEVARLGARTYELRRL